MRSLSCCHRYETDIPRILNLIPMKHFYHHIDFPFPHNSCMARRDFISIFVKLCRFASNSDLHICKDHLILEKYSRLYDKSQTVS